MVPGQVVHRTLTAKPIASAKKAGRMCLNCTLQELTQCNRRVTLWIILNDIQEIVRNVPKQLAIVADRSQQLAPEWQTQICSFKSLGAHHHRYQSQPAL